MGRLLAIIITLSVSLSAQPGPAQILQQVEARLKTDSGNPRLLLTRGAALQALGRDREALDSFSKALTISPKFLAALEGAAQSSYRLHAPKTLSYLNRILEQEPNNPTAHAMAGELAFERRDCSAANRHFSAAEKEVSTDAAALQHWGQCLVATGSPHDGSLHLQQASTLAPQDHGVLFDCALALFLDSQYDSALIALEAVPQNAQTLNLKANIYAAQNKLSEAIATFRQATEVAPKDESNYVDLASLCLEHQSFDVAHDVVNTGIANIPDSAALYTLRGAIAAQTADVESSMADFERARRLQPMDDYGDVGLSLLLRQQNHIDEAVALIRKRLASSPNDAKLNFLLADLLLQSAVQAPAAKSEAEKLLRKAIRLNPRLARSHASLGKLLLSNNQPQASVTELEQAIALDDNDRVALNQYILALKRLGRVEEANATARRLRDILAEGRATEVRKNRVRFVLNSQPSQ
jgi:tetratricopeptide (TPR) repeat protein